MPTITLPTLHAGQVELWKRRSRFNAVRCGRRWGKDVMQATLAADAAVKGRYVGLFAPEHKQLAEPFDTLIEILAPVIKRRSMTDGLIHTTTGGRIDFWSTTDNPLAGRGRKYHLCCVNEAAFAKSPQMLDIWRKSIRPTLTDYAGGAWVFSTPNGIDPENFFSWACSGGDDGFVEHHAPTSNNPHIPISEIELYRKTNHHQVFKQEYLAEFIDWSGEALFSHAKWVQADGTGWPMPQKCDVVFAKIDSALKSGKDHDATAVLYCARVNQFEPEFRKGMALLDYDIKQIDADLLIGFLPKIYERLEVLARRCGAARNIGLIIEDKGSGIILIQHCKRNGWPVIALDSKFVAIGKDERAMATAGYHEMGLSMLTAECLAKEATLKGVTRNHLVSQVTGYRIADKNSAKRADDLADTYTGALHSMFGQHDGV